MLIVNNIKKSTEWEATTQIKGNYTKDFNGLKSIVESKSGDVTNILLIHGVRKTNSTHFDSLIQMLTKGMDLIKSNRSPIKTIVTGEEGKIAGRGNVRIQEFTNRSYTDTVRFYNIMWSGITLPAKDMVTNLDKNPYRTAVSHAVKNDNLIDVFGDIALYVSPFRKNIFETIDTALIKMYEVDPFNDENIRKESPDDIVMVTGSFGSKIVFDFLVEKLKTNTEARTRLNALIPQIPTLLKVKKTEEEFKNSLIALINAEQKEIIELHKGKQGTFDPYHLNKAFEEIEQQLADSYGIYDDKEGIANACENYLRTRDSVYESQNEKYSIFAQKLKTVFMLSNQLPFLSGIDLSPMDTATRAAFIENIYQNIDTLMDISSDIVETSKELKIVSFHDPNDVFGYRLPDPGTPSSLKVTNVEFYNTIQWSFNPIKVRQNFLSGINNPAFKQATLSLFRQDTTRQALNFALQKANASAKNNRYLVNHIILGSDYGPPVDQVRLVKRKTKGLRKVKRDSVKVLGVTEGFTKEPKGFFTFIKKVVENNIRKSYTRKIKKLEIKPAWLDFDLPAEGIDFKGLEDGFTNNDSLVNILTIHGISSKNPENFDIMIYGIAEKLKFNLKPKIKTINMADSYSGKMAGVTQIRLIEFSNTKSQKLRFFDIYWSPMTFPVKTILNKLDNEDGMEDKRGVFPKAVKNGLVNDGLSDVTLMINKFSTELHHCLDSAFHLMLSDNPFSEDSLIINTTDHQKNNYFISGSLGSKLLYEYFVTCLDTAQLNRTDSLMPYREHITSEATENARLMLKKLHTFFMLTNQLPLVALKNLNPNMDTNKEDFIKHVYGQWDALSPHHDTLNIVAFNDPNDILSFILPPSTGV